MEFSTGGGNDPNKVKKCHMFQVIEIFQAREISKYFLPPIKKHTLNLTTVHVNSGSFSSVIKMLALFTMNYCKSALATLK